MSLAAVGKDVILLVAVSDFALSLSLLLVLVLDVLTICSSSSSSDDPSRFIAFCFLRLRLRLPPIFVAGVAVGLLCVVSSHSSSVSLSSIARSDSSSCDSSDSSVGCIAFSVAVSASIVVSAGCCGRS